MGPDGLARTPWGAHDPLLQEYYDTEWGALPTGIARGGPGNTSRETEDVYFERLALEGFQAGLSWLTILRKRPRFREVFADFSVDAVATFTESDVERLLTDPGIIRHRGKIEATVRNALATRRLREEVDGGLPAFIESHAPTATPEPRVMAEVPTTSAESLALSKALKKKGLSFVGPTTCYALFEALGIVDTHLLGSHRRGASGRWER
ncbi:DNA-3-methyladenine glycosylase I [Brevibacterium litoralis]|uniref:DNA-3-methyladenine glycosylase I n=1 Tax=Brevibacterium litoralis TaxID=3138935 RepID=UPI0032EC3CA8